VGNSRWQKQFLAPLNQLQPLNDKKSTKKLAQDLKKGKG